MEISLYAAIWHIYDGMGYLYLIGCVFPQVSCFQHEQVDATWRPTLALCSSSNGTHDSHFAEIVYIPKQHTECMHICRDSFLPLWCPQTLECQMVVSILLCPSASPSCWNPSSPISISYSWKYPFCLPRLTDFWFFFPFSFLDSQVSWKSHTHSQLFLVAQNLLLSLFLLCNWLTYKYLEDKTSCFLYIVLENYIQCILK